jgi:molecular chaperone GrpE (heat shock protein)
LPTGSQADELATGTATGAQADTRTAESQAGPAEEVMLAELTAEVRRLATAAEQYQERARQREGVIDYLRSELDLLRRGERRGLLRPILTEMSRLHADLARQATSLPPDYTAERAANLLGNYADSLKDALEDNGVVTYAPEAGDAFDPRRHRQIKTEATADPDLDGRVASVRKDGYLDIAANSLLSPAEITLYKTVKEEQ